LLSSWQEKRSVEAGMEKYATGDLFGKENCTVTPTDSSCSFLPLSLRALPLLLTLLSLTWWMNRASRWMDNAADMFACTSALTADLTYSAAKMFSEDSAMEESIRTVTRGRGECKRPSHVLCGRDKE
jgi:hypothetical protein